MFTEEEKIRAIELYFKYGKKQALVVRELGYSVFRSIQSRTGTEVRSARKTSGYAGGYLFLYATPKFFLPHP